MIAHFFAENEVSEIWLTFPDPQMKKTTKRLTATNFISSYLQFLKPGGIIHLKTDSNFMFTYTCEMVKLNEFPVLFCNDDLYGSGLVDPILSIKTHYEKQWLERGLTIKYIKFIPQKDKELTEPEVEIEHDSYRSYGRNKTQHVNG
jgi:tRNA (guanine-N7-)-methyltransferase